MELNYKEAEELLYEDLQDAAEFYDQLVVDKEIEDEGNNWVYRFYRM